MSSTYQAICLNHNPAIEIQNDYDTPQWTDQDTALGAIARRTGDLAAHKDCDLVLGAYSYPLVDICCPANAHKHVRGITVCCHSTDKWINVRWLRLLIAALTDPTPATTAVIDRTAIDLCWVPERVLKLRNLLMTGDDQ